MTPHPRRQPDERPPRPRPARRRPPGARRVGAVLAALTLAGGAGLSGCGAKRDVTSAGAARPLSLMLDFFPNADHAALYDAIGRGYFRRAGLAVSPQVPANPSAPLTLLAAGRVDMAISYEPELLLARDHGLPLVSIAALVQTPLTSFISLGDRHIRRVADLKGRKVGTAGIPYQSAELSTALSAARVPRAQVHEVDVGFNLVPAMLSHRVDATLGGFWNYEAIQLAQAHKHPRVIRIDRAGVPTYDELVLVVRQDEVRRDAPLLRAFLQALTQGEQDLRADPAGAIGGLLGANRDLDRRLQLASVRATLPVTRPPAGRPFGYQDPRTWQAFGRWMRAHGLLKQPPVVAAELTNQLLPGQGL